jgi:hypothetical protein
VRAGTRSRRGPRTTLLWPCDPELAVDGGGVRACSRNHVIAACITLWLASHTCVVAPVSGATPRRAPPATTPTDADPPPPTAEPPPADEPPPFADPPPTDEPPPSDEPPPGDVTPPDDTTPPDDAAPTEPEPEVAPPPAAATPSPPPPIRPRPPQEPEPPKRQRRWPEPLRRGGLVMAGVGAAGCGQGACDPIKAAAWFTLTGGYRFGRFAPIVQIAGGGTPAKGPGAITVDDTQYQSTSSNGSLSLFYVGGGTLLHLLASTNIDPYFGLTLGYMQVREHMRARANAGATTVEIDHRQITHRGAIGIIVGLGFRIVERFTLGPRFDFLVPFAGRTCGRDFGTNSGCGSLGSLEVDASEYFPRPWTFTLQAGFVI